MVRFLWTTLIYLLSSAVGLLVANLILDDMTVTAAAFVWVVVIFTVVQAIITPFLFKAVRRNASALIGAVGLISTFVVAAGRLLAVRWPEDQRIDHLAVGHADRLAGHHAGHAVAAAVHRQGGAGRQGRWTGRPGLSSTDRALTVWRRREGTTMATRIVIMGGGPAGYEAALVAAQYGADVTLVEDQGVGGSCVLADCVPSKTFIASAGGRTDTRQAGHLGIDIAGAVSVDVPGGARPRHGLALAQSADIRARLISVGVRLVDGRARWPTRVPVMALHRVAVTRCDGASRRTDRGRRADRHRRDAAGAAHRGAGRRADPDLAAGLRPARAARAPDRRRLRRDRRRVRLRLHRDGRPGDPDLQPRPGAAGRGRRRRRGDRGRLRRTRRGAGQAGPGGIGGARRRRRPGDADRRSDRSAARTP